MTRLYYAPLGAVALLVLPATPARGDDRVLERSVLACHGKEAPVLRLVTVADAPAVRPGRPITFRISIANSGSLPAQRAVVVSDLTGLRRAASYAGARADRGRVTVAGPRLVWTGGVPVNAAVTVTVRARVRDRVRAQSLLPPRTRPVRGSLVCLRPHIWRGAAAAIAIRRPPKIRSGPPVRPPAVRPAPVQQPRRPVRQRPDRRDAPVDPAAGMGFPSPAPPSPPGPAPRPPDESRTLPFTGQDVALYGGAALALAGVGVGLIRLGRRRSRW